MNLKFVVAVGYSEGGLTSLLSFFDHVPHDQATYIILRHIPVGQQSVLKEILNRHSKLEIMEVEDGMKIENDFIYIPPSSSYITIQNDKLYLHPRVHEKINYNYSINVFLQSLAREKGKKSIAIILSGNGSDGAEGVTHIYRAGGIVFAQSPDSCINPEMPQSAIDTKCVHHILLPSEMPPMVVKHAAPRLKNANEMRRLKK
jgi:two-component system CheB/CheR fusion protein